MRLNRFIVLIVGLLSFASANAQGPGPASLPLEEGSNGTLTVRFEWGNFFVGVANEKYDALHAEGMTTDNGEPGKPALPTLSRTVSLPRGSRLTINTVEHSEEVWDSFIDADRPLAPTAGAWVKDSLWPGYHPDKATYAADAYYRGGEPLEIRHIGTMGSREVYCITVRPVAYNPVRHSLLVSTTLQATLSKDITPARIIDSTLPERYLIVSRPQFSEGLQPFIQWKQQEGFEVEEIYADTNKRDVVKALIASRWETPDGRWPSYILLVGDVAQLQAYLGTTRPQELNNHITDLYYAEHTGDYLPDALIGRWPVNDTAELRAVMEKTLRYEQCIDLADSMLNRALLVAGKEAGTPAPVTTNGQVNYLKGRLKQQHPNVDTTCHYNPASNDERDQILAEIALGASFINYTAHCGTSGWTRPAVGFTSIDTLGCTQPTLYVNNCCQSNDFGGTCFGELLLRKAQGGAFGVIGATNSTLWNEDYYWAVGPKHPFSLEPQYDSLHRGAFDQWFDGKTFTLGGLMTAGNMAVTAFGSPYDKFYWEIYNLLGDPSLRPFLGAPSQLFFSAPDTLTVGATNMRVSGSPGAKVTAMQGGQLLGMVTLDNHRSMDIPFRQSVDSLPIVVTVTMAQAMPIIDTIYTAWPHERAVAFRNVTVNDTTIDFTLVNLSADTLYDVVVQLLCDDTLLAIFDATPDYADTLLPRAEAPMHISMSVLQWERLWCGSLHAYSTTSGVDSPSLRLRGRLDGVPPTMQFLLFNSDTITATSIEPNTDYLLLTAVEGLCDSLSISVTAYPTNSSLLTPNSSLLTELTSPDTVTHLRIEAMVTHGNYRQDYDIWMVAGSRMDSFEEGFDNYPWDRSSLRPWIIDSTVYHNGSHCMRSAPITSRLTSDIALDVSLVAADSISFWARTSSEQGYDKLGFYIDGVRQMDLSGNMGWRRCAFAVAPGSHRLLWRYTKDDSTDQGSDCAWIDDVQMPMAQWAAPYGWFGTFDEPLAIDPTPNTQHSTLSIVPNPTSGMITVNGAVSIILLDIYGRQLMSAEGSTADLSALPSGTYIAAINTGNTIVYERIIKQ